MESAQSSPDLLVEFDVGEQRISIKLFKLAEICVTLTEFYNIFQSSIARNCWQSTT